MAKERRPDLDLELDDAFHRRESRVQRVGWTVLAVIILAALLGLTGSGPLAKRRVSASGLDVHWERIARAEARTEIRIETQAALVRDDTLVVRIARPAFDDFQAEEIRPQPERVSVGEAFIEYRFGVPAGARQTTILLVLRPERMGEHELNIAVAGAPAAVIRQFALP